MSKQVGEVGLASPPVTRSPLANTSVGRAVYAELASELDILLDRVAAVGRRLRRVAAQATSGQAFCAIGRAPHRPRVVGRAPGGSREHENEIVNVGRPAAGSARTACTPGSTGRRTSPSRACRFARWISPACRAAGFELDRVPACASALRSARGRSRVVDSCRGTRWSHWRRLEDAHAARSESAPREPKRTGLNASTLTPPPSFCSTTLRICASSERRGRGEQQSNR